MKQNHAIQRIIRISRSLLVLSVAVLATACSQHDDAYKLLPPAPLNPNVTFEVRIPRVNTPSTSTYGMTSAQENKINEATVLAYRNIGGAELLIQKVKVAAENIISDAAGNAKIKASIPGGKYHRLVLITNADTQLTTLALDSDLNVLNSLEYTHNTGEWDTSNPTPDYIPMSGELVAGSLNGFEIKQAISKDFGTIKLIRMLARIDIRNTSSRFSLKEIKLYNMNRNGLIVQNANYSNTPAEPNLPATLQKATSPITHTATGETFNQEMYVFESAAPTTASLVTTSPRIVIKGEFDNIECYYPVDFTYPRDRDDKTKVNFMPIVRNYQYIFMIEVSEEGFDTAEEALASPDVFTNIKVVVIDDDFTDVYYNPDNFLAVNVTNTKIVMGKTPYNISNDDKKDNTVTVLTDADNFTIECYDTSGKLAEETKMQPNLTSYTGGTKTDAYLIANYTTTGMDETEFEGYIIVKAGKLQSEKIPVYKVWCGIAGVPMINTVGATNVYKTHRYPTGTDGAMECWMVENSLEGGTNISGKGYGWNSTGSVIGTITNSDDKKHLGQVNGYYYTWAKRANACPTGWSVPSSTQWEKLRANVSANYATNNTAIWWMGPRGTVHDAFAGFYNGSSWTGWGWSSNNIGHWWENTTRVSSSGTTTTFKSSTASSTYWYSVRCVKN